MLPETEKKPSEYYTINKAAELLGVSSWTLRNWDKKGKLKAMRHPINGYRIYRHEDLEEIFQGNHPQNNQAANFAPKVDWDNIGKTEHFVQFYENDAALVNSVSRFMAVSLKNGEGGVVIATQAHQYGINEALSKQGIDLTEALNKGQYVCLDADEILSKFMIDGIPDRQLFNKVIGEIIIRTTDKFRYLRAFGEMVAILWDQENQQAAIILEELWNDLSEIYQFSLFCAYPLKAFSKVKDSENFNYICGCHSQAIPTEHYVTMADEQRLHSICQLQQKALSLEAEIEHRKAVEKSLLKHKLELADFFENAAEGIHKVGADGTIIWANKAELKLLGYEAHEYIGHHIAKFHADLEVIEDILARLKRSETLQDYEVRLLCKDGSIKHVIINSNGFWEDGKFLYSRCFTRDVTEKRRVQKQLHEALEKAQSANIAKTEFLANMSHEIRTPMNAIMGLSHLLGISQPLTAKQAEFIKTLQLSADYLLLLISDLLDISKIEARTMKLENMPFCLTQLTQEVTNMISLRAKEKGLTFTFEAEFSNSKIFMGDSTRLRQIILNLCSNAVKFTEYGGVHISITSEATPEPDVENICIVVKDTGIGIAEDKLDIIFQKFVQADSSISRKYGGTGLGLAITKTLIEIMDGTIKVESKLEEGSVFTVSLPLRRVTQEPLEIEIPVVGTEQEIISDSNRILLAEDHPANVLVATTYLEEFGYSYDVAHNGMEAVEKAMEGNYMAILMDIQMYGMDGFEATNFIREHEKKSGKPRTLIIGMTAHALAGDRERCIASGMDDYISKPFSPNLLRKKLENACENAMESA